MNSTNHHTGHAAMISGIDKDSIEMQKTMPAGPTTSNMLSHTLAANDPDNPMNWPAHRRLYASAVAFAMAFAV